MSRNSSPARAVERAQRLDAVRRPRRDVELGPQRREGLLQLPAQQRLVLGDDRRRCFHRESPGAPRNRSASVHENAPRRRRARRAPAQGLNAGTSPALQRGAASHRIPQRNARAGASAGAQVHRGRRRHPASTLPPTGWTTIEGEAHGAHVAIRVDRDASRGQLRHAPRTAGPIYIAARSSLAAECGAPRSCRSGQHRAQPGDEVDRAGGRPARIFLVSRARPPPAFRTGSADRCAPAAPAGAPSRARRARRSGAHAQILQRGRAAASAHVMVVRKDRACIERHRQSDVRPHQGGLRPLSR